MVAAACKKFLVFQICFDQKKAHRQSHGDMYRLIQSFSGKAHEEKQRDPATEENQYTPVPVAQKTWKNSGHAYAQDYESDHLIAYSMHHLLYRDKRKKNGHRRKDDAIE
ncbi:MAG: hypothetical protein R3F51_20235 [Cyanobacteriota/Melainabacteria group bacterium]